MNTKTTETPIKTQPQEQEAPRPWVTPNFERVPLNEALSGMIGVNDGSGFGS